MKKFLIVATATFGAGTRLGLSKDQAAARSHALKPSGKGVFEVVTPVQFKAGEVIVVDGDLPKVLAELVEPAKTAEPAPQA